MLTILPYMASVESSASQHNGSSNNSNDTEESSVNSTSAVIAFVPSSAPIPPPLPPPPSSSSSATTISSSLSIPSISLCNNSITHTVSSIPSTSGVDSNALHMQTPHDGLTVSPILSLPKLSTLLLPVTTSSYSSHFSDLNPSPPPKVVVSQVSHTFGHRVATNTVSPIYSAPTSQKPVSVSHIRRLPLSNARGLKCVPTSHPSLKPSANNNNQSIHLKRSSHSTRPTQQQAQQQQPMQDISSIQKEIDNFLLFSVPTDEKPMHNTLMRACQVALQLDSLWPCKSSIEPEAHGRQQMFRVLSTLNPTDDTDSSSSSDEDLKEITRDPSSPIFFGSSTHVSSMGSNTNTTGLRRNLDMEEKYLGRRLRTHAQMQWIHSELMSTKLREVHLNECKRRLLAASSCNLKPVTNTNKVVLSESLVKTEDDISQDKEEISSSSSFGCSRVCPYEKTGRPRQSFTTLSCNPNLLHYLNPAFSEPGIDGCHDARIQCQCRHPETGPCILCLGQCHRTVPIKPIVLRYPWDEASSAVRLAPIDMNIHPILSSFSDRSLHLDASHRLGNSKYSGRKVHWSQLPWRTSTYYGGVPASVRHQYSFSLPNTEYLNLPKQQQQQDTTLSMFTSSKQSNLDENTSTSTSTTIHLLSKRHKFCRKKSTCNISNIKKLLSKTPPRSRLSGYRWNTSTNNTSTTAKMISSSTQGNNSQQQKNTIKKYLVRCGTRPKKFKSNITSRLSNKHKSRISTCGVTDNNASSLSSSSRVGSLLLEALQQRRENMRDIPIPPWCLFDENKDVNTTAAIIASNTTITNSTISPPPPPCYPLSSMDDAAAAVLLQRNKALSSVVTDSCDVVTKLKVERLTRLVEDTSDTVYRSMHATEKEFERQRLHHVPVAVSSTAVAAAAAASTSNLVFNESISVAAIEHSTNLPLQRPLSASFNEGMCSARKDSLNCGSAIVGGGGGHHTTRRHSQSSTQDDIISRYKPSSNMGYKILSFPLTSESIASLRRNDLV